MSAPEQQAADPPDRCERCRCDDCNGRLDQHAPTGCTCKDCAGDAELACTAFLLPGRITLLAEQLGPLLSSHLHERARRRCLAVAHAAHHALLDYDYPEDAE